MSDAKKFLIRFLLTPVREVNKMRKIEFKRSVKPKTMVTVAISFWAIMMFTRNLLLIALSFSLIIIALAYKQYMSGDFRVKKPLE